jgi:arsenite methyltransferase
LRVLKPGDHFCVSDVIATGMLPEGIRRAAALYVGCIAGAMPEADYLAVIRQTGFRDVGIVERKPVPLPDELLREHLSEPELVAFRTSGGLLSVAVLGTKPSACCGDDCCRS